MRRDQAGLDLGHSHLAHRGGVVVGPRTPLPCIAALVDMA